MCISVEVGPSTLRNESLLLKKRQVRVMFRDRKPFYHLWNDTSALLASEASMVCLVANSMKAFKSLPKHFLLSIFPQASNAKWLFKCVTFDTDYFWKKTLYRRVPKAASSPVILSPLLSREFSSIWIVFLCKLRLMVWFGQPDLPLEIRNSMNTASILRQGWGKRRKI